VYAQGFGWPLKDTLETGRSDWKKYRARKDAAEDLNRWIST